MSWHCWICGNPDNWIRGRQYDDRRSDMVQITFTRGLKEREKKLNYYVVHLDCFVRAIRNAQIKFMCDGEILGLEDMKKRIMEGDDA